MKATPLLQQTWLRCCSARLLSSPAGSERNHRFASVRRVVFVGNCQLDTLANLYRRVAGPESNDGVAYVPSYKDADAGQRKIIQEADVLVQQVLDFAPRIGDLATRATVHLVQHITGAFFWPYTGQPHPRNAPAPYLDGSGPYPPELGDSFLNP